MPGKAAVVAVTATEKDRDGGLRVWLNAAYVRAIEGAGLVPLVVPPLTHPDQAAAVLGRVDGLVLTGGEDIDPAHYGAAMHPKGGPPHAARDATELALAREARDRRLPTLAICRGIQIVNVALGGTLIQDLPSERPRGTDHDPGADRASRSHDLVVERGSRLAEALGATELAVNSSHHQAVDAVGHALVASAHSPDGVVEGLETPKESDWWMIAVQWHPEELTGDAAEWDRGLFRAFAEKVRSRARTPL